jgi:hypothetical protein
MKIAMGILALAAAAGTASASLYVEQEGNNSAGTANNLNQVNGNLPFTLPGGSILVDGSVTGGGANIAGDVDWFSFTIANTASNVVASIFSLNNTQADSEIYLIAGDGTTIIAFNDDGNPGGGSGFMSSLITANLAAGTYFLVVTGDNDSGTTVGTPALPDGWNGGAAPVQGQGVGHGENFDYKFLVGFNIIPTPGATALLGLGALAAGRRRR